MSVYAIKAMGDVEEYINIDGCLFEIAEYCRKSEIHFLNQDKLYITSNDFGGTEFPEILASDGIYLFSDKVIKNINNEFAIDRYVFLKPVEISCDIVAKKELYWIVVPARIDCLNLDSSEIVYDWDFDLGIIPVLHCKKIVIDEELTGNFKMFKILGIDDNTIYIDEELENIIASMKIDSIKIIECEED